MLKFNKTHCSAAISEAKMLLILLEARKLFIFNTILTCTGADRPACLLYIQCKTVLPHSNIKLFCFPLVLQKQPQWVYAVLHHLRRWRRSKHSSLGQICTAQGTGLGFQHLLLFPPPTQSPALLTLPLSWNILHWQFHPCAIHALVALWYRWLGQHDWASKNHMFQSLHHSTCNKDGAGGLLKVINQFFTLSVRAKKNSLDPITL